MYFIYNLTKLFSKNSRLLLSKKSNYIKEVSRSLKRIPSQMPRNRPEVSALQEVRQKKRRQCKNAGFIPSEIYLCVLGNGSNSSPKALYMFTDHERYLFNCGEGTQRLSTEHKMKLSKLDNIFITHNSWDNIGGLLGLSLTIQDIGVPKITLHGPSGIDSVFEHAKSFVFLKNLSVGAKNVSEEKFSDDCMDVFYIPIFSEDSPADSCSNSSESSSQDSDEDITNEPRFKKRRHSFKRRHREMIVAYACKAHSKPGHLLFEKCIEQGVPAGPLLGDLKNGKNVTLPSGKVVQSKDVVSEAQDSPPFLVVECPSHKFLHPFVNEKKFCKYQDNPSDPSSEAAALIVHFTPPEILNDDIYQSWMKRFPATTCHLVLNKDNATLNSTGVHRIQHQLNLLHSGIFSLLHESEVVKTSVEKQNLNIIQANTLERYYLRPSKGLDRSISIKLNPEEFIEEAVQTDNFVESLNHLKKDIQHSFHQTNIPDNHFPVITFLGTGSSIPCKARNVSAIMLNTSQNKYVLLDCGEGTHDQIVRLFGREYKKVLENINCIFISHLHADHHLGLIKILKAREKVFQSIQNEIKPLLIIGPTQLNVWLRLYHRNVEPITYLYRFLECNSLEHNQLQRLENNVHQMVQNLKISTVPVYHCSDAHGAIIEKLEEGESKWKIVYSGDTMPCENLVNAGQNCSVLIHEATMEDDLLEEAIIKRHSTTSQAIKIGEDMKSKYTILTHFSQRYAKIPLFNENFHNYVGCAFDNMTVRSDELYILPLLIPTLNCLFAEDVDDINIKGLKRRKRTELIKQILSESVAKSCVKS